MLSPIEVKFQRVIEIEAVVGRMGNAAYQHTLVQNDTGPVIQFACKKVDGSALDLSGATVEFLIRRADAESHVNVGHEACSGVDLANGRVAYQFQPGDLSGVGSHFGDLRVIFDSGERETGFDPVRLLVRKSNE